jgi:hypothetical protein
VDNAQVPATPPSTQTTGEAGQVWSVMQNTTSIAVLEDFVRQFGATPYGSLARARLDELKKQVSMAQEASSAKSAAAAETEKRAKAEQEAKAEEAKAAEAARIKAEQDAKAVAEAARAKAEQEARAAAEAARIKAEETKAATTKAATEAAQRPQNLAALTPSDQSPQSTKSPALSPGEIVRRLQIELRRVGCLTSDVYAEWNANSGHALELFNEHTGMNLDTRAASLGALDAVRSKSPRVCPLVCQRGFHTVGERCVETKQAPPVHGKPTNEASKGSSGGVMVCDKQGCRQAPPGCKPHIQGMYGATTVCE